MSALLQRLLGRAAPAGAPGMLAPALPAAALSSPLALHDQRLSLPAFEALPPVEPAEPLGDAPDEQTVFVPGPRPDPVPRRRTAEPARRDPAELRIVSGEPPASPPAKPVPTHQQPPLKSAGPTPERVPVLKADPLDIGAEAFEPARRDGGGHVDAGEDAKATPASDPPPRPATPLPLAPPEEPEAPRGPSAEPGAADPSPRPPQLRLGEPRETVPSPELVPVELAPPARQQLMPVEPAAPEFDAIPDEQEDPRSEPAPMPDEARGGPAVSIGEIVIEVREPFQAVQAQTQRPSVAPSSAAAASLIGPLPVRRSAISLYGMRRR